MTLQIIKVSKIPKPAWFRGRARSALRDMTEFKGALDAMRKDMPEQDEAIEMTLSSESLKKFKDVKNLETRIVQLLLGEIKLNKYPFKVRKLTLSKDERPHIYLVRNPQIIVEPDQKDELFEQELRNASNTSNTNRKHRTVAA